MMKINTSQARIDLAEIANRVQYRHERVVLTKYNKAVAAIVSVEDLRLIEMIEDRMDLEDAKKVLADSGERIPFDEIRRRLDL